MHKKNIVIVLVALILWQIPFMTFSQYENRLDYGEGLILDSDLDGLTDLGEKEIYQTDQMNPDSDGDGFYDGTETIKKTDPLDGLSPKATKMVVNQEKLIENEVPLGWYVSRASGMMGFFLLWLVMFFGLAIRTPVIRNIFPPVFSMDIHRWLSLQALFFVFLHAGALLFDRYLNLGILDLIIPFHSPKYVLEITLGILGLYLMIMMIVTSYFRNLLSFQVWRFVHFMNLLLFFLVVFHALWIGTDLKEGFWLRSVFLGMNIFLLMVMAFNLIFRLKKWILSKKKQN